MTVKLFGFIGEPQRTRGQHGVFIRGGHKRPDDPEHIFVHDPDFGDMQMCRVDEAGEHGFVPVVIQDAEDEEFEDTPVF